MAVQQVVSARETYEAKIRALQQALAETESHLTALAWSNASRRSKKLLLELGLVAATLVFAVLSLSAFGWALGSQDGTTTVKDRIGSSLFALGLAWASWYSFRNYRASCKRFVEDEVDRASEQKARDLRQLIATTEEEQRTLLLAHNENLARTDSVLNETRGGKFGGDEKECPQCAESVRSKAKLCRFCGHKFEVAAAADA